MSAKSAVAFSDLVWAWNYVGKAARGRNAALVSRRISEGFPQQLATAALKSLLPGKGVRPISGKYSR